MNELFQIDDEELRQYMVMQPDTSFPRNVDGTFETVSYTSGGFLFWINDATRGYATHWHPAVEIITVLEGDYSVEAEGVTYEMNAGDILLIPSGTLHVLNAPKGGKRLIYLTELSRFSGLEGYNYLNALFSHPILLSDRESPEIILESRKYIIAMLREYYSSNLFREMAVSSEMLHFLVGFLRFLACRNSDDLSENNRAKQDNLHKHIIPVLDYIDKNYSEDITLEKASEIARFSKYHFSRIFKDATGCHFSEYLCIHRTKIAADLLAKSSLPVTDIALRSGFSSLSTFNRIFKKQKGCTPSRYRQMFNVN